jgi:hypothetical protein
MRLHIRLVAPVATLSAAVFAAVTVAGQSAPAAPATGQAPAAAPAQPPPPPGPPQLTPEQQAARAKLQEESRADHADMMKQLGITALRPGRNSRADQPNAANYDEAQANPYPKLPELMVLENGTAVTTKAQWETRRREIMEAFEREVVGRVPKDVPKVTWTVEETVNTSVGGVPVVGRRVIGRPDNSGAPDIKVEMALIVVTPAKADKPVPVMVMFRGGQLPGPPGSPALDFFGRPVPPPGPGEDPPGTEQLIKAGWGYAFLNPSSVQADNGAGLTKGIIGLVNKGQRRKPEDWGSLRAWGWGASRALDFFETDKTIDARRIGIDGVSRYGKAALVTMAFDPRFAVVLVASSGEGGAKLHRRNFGEAVENLTASGQYHWMAGNFLKYGASEATFGAKTANDIPVDAHQLIALCAPRPTFISYGVPEKGDALWLDQQGSFMAAVAAQPAFRLLGAKDLGRSDDYMKEKMPPVNTLIGGQLAWRQHDGGHTDQPNWKHFIPWADKMLGRAPAAQGAPSAP